MANLLRRRRAPARVPRVLTAAAQRIRADDPTETRRAKKRRQDWQDLAWRYYDELGEVKYSTNLIANTLSKLSLFVALPADDPEADPERVKDENVQDLLEPLATPGSGHAHLLRDIGINYTIPGECYLIGRDAASDDGEFVDQTDQAWSVRSIDEIRMQGERWSLYDADTRESVELGAGDYVARLWRPHARRYEVADAPLRGVLSSCEQILILEQEIRATSRSRLSVGGILVVPQELSFGSTDPATANAGDGEATDNPFLADLMESLVTPIGDEGSASAVVPHVLEVASELVDKIKFVPFRRDRDQFLDKELERAIRRLAQGLNVPVEVVIGMEDVNHWTAWQIEESTFKAHVEPLALEILHSLTVGYLRPTLQAAGVADADRMFIWYDASRLFAKPTRTQDAKDAHTAVAISDKALRDVLHFSDEDAPDDDEIARRIVTRRGAVDAEIMLMLLRLAMPELAERIETQPAEGTPMLPPAEEPPSRPTPPEEGPPPAVDAPPPQPEAPSLAAAATSERSRLGQRLADIDDRLRTRLEVAADAALRRALERAGAKLRTKLRRDEHAREAIRDAAAHEIAARLGPALVAQAGLPDEELEDALADLEPRFERWAAAAQQEALDAIGIEGDARADVERELEEDRKSAWTWLAAALLTLARKRLFDPSPDAPLEGEFDETLAVPPGLIREALARAGGTKDITRLADWAALSESGTRPLGGVATGDRLLGLIGRQGGGVEGYEWDYGAFPRTRPFDPHLALDGVIFENFDDPRLTNVNSFPPVAFYLPGDHAGCQCNLVPVIVAPQIFPEPVIA